MAKIIATASTTALVVLAIIGVQSRLSPDALALLVAFALLIVLVLGGLALAIPLLMVADGMAQRRAPPAQLPPPTVIVAQQQPQRHEIEQR